MGGNSCKCPRCGELHYTLTPRHLEVVAELALHPGATTRQLAQNLSISPNTIKRHLADIYRELRVSNRLDCMIACLTLGIITVEQLQISELELPGTSIHR